ncbi:hypothetical protein AKJ16_DCAP10209 [Drosera capensis]
MSRCFPFPPPGYEKKSTFDDPDLLKKEKRDKEKKEGSHKKEKKDKERKEGKEKKEKSRSDEKRRESKDKKEKRRDKKKEKEKNQDADKKEIPSDPRSVVEQFHGENGETSTEKSKDRERGKSISSDSKRVPSSGHSSAFNGVEFRHVSHPTPETNNVKCTQSSGSRTANEGKRPAKPFLETERRKDEGMPRLAVNSTSILGVGNDRNMEKRVNGGRIDVGTEETRPMDDGRVGGMERHTEKKNIDFRIEGQDKVGENAAKDRKSEKRKERDKDKSSKKDKDLEKEKKKEEKARKKEEKLREQSSRSKESGMSPVEQSRMKDISKHPMELPRMKETGKSPLGKSRIDDGGKSSIAQSRVKEVKMSDLLGVLSSPLNIPRESSKMASVDEGLRKRKEVEPAKVVLEDDVGSNKKARTSSSHPLVQNGRNMEPSWSSNSFASHQAPNHVKAEGGSEVFHASSTFLPDAQAPNHVKAEIKERKLNGTIDVRLPRRPTPATAYPDQNKAAQGSRMSSPATAYVDQKAEAPRLKISSPAKSYADPKAEAQQLRRPSPANSIADQKTAAQHLRQPSPASPFAGQKTEAKPVGMFSPPTVSAIQRTEVQPGRPSPTTLFEHQKAEASKKPEHPDAKHLSQVLVVPKPAELSEDNDQDWLFSRSSRSGTMKTVNPGAQETPQVWAEAVRIESADIVALPYVIPF